MESADPGVRRDAVYRMSLRPRGTPLAQVLEALSDPDWRVRREAISLASQTDDQNDLIDALLVRVVETDNIGLRNAAIEVLGLVGQGKADRFARACEVAGEGARKFLVEAMGKTRDPQMIAKLEAFIRESDPNTAAAAVEALVRIGGVRAEALSRNSLRVLIFFCGSRSSKA
jgi:HEAT repeat protein